MSNICTNPGASSHQIVFFGRGGLGRFDCGFGFGFVGHCKQFSEKGRCIIAATCFFWGGLGKIDFGSGFGFGGRAEQCLYKARCVMPANRFFFEGGGGVRLRDRLRVRWSLRAISAQILVHPIKMFFLSMGGWGGSTSGSASGSVVIASNFCTKAGRGGGGSTSGSASGSVVIASNICTNPGASSHQTVFFGRGGGWGRSTSGSASGSVVVPSNVCTKPGASSQQTVFFLRGGWGRFDFGFGRGSLWHK